MGKATAIAALEGVTSVTGSGGFFKRPPRPSPGHHGGQSSLGSEIQLAGSEERAGAVLRGGPFCWHGTAMFQMLGVFAEFERAMIKERVRAGLARAKAAGTKLGRPSLPQAVRRQHS